MSAPAVQWFETLLGSKTDAATPTTTSALPLARRPAAAGLDVAQPVGYTGPGRLVCGPSPEARFDWRLHAQGASWEIPARGD